jgi:hypothetical protein
VQTAATPCSVPVRMLQIRVSYTLTFKKHHGGGGGRRQRKYSVTKRHFGESLLPSKNNYRLLSGPCVRACMWGPEGVGVCICVRACSMQYVTNTVSFPFLL